MLPLRLVGVSVCVAIMLMYFYCPLPDGLNADDRWILRKFYAMDQAGKVVSKLAALIGYDSLINITRAFRNSRFAIVEPDNYAVLSTNHDFDGVNVTIHRKSVWTDGQPLRSALVYMHGGGWVYEYRELYAIFERYLAEQSEFTIVSVDYPLAPENPYPVPFQACLNAIKYLHKNAPTFGVDPRKISVGGDSAGGNLAAAVALKLRDEGDSFLQRQVLISPALQFATFRLNSFQENDFGLLTKRGMVHFWLHYINEGIQFTNELESNEHLSKGVIQSTGWPFLEKYQKFPQSHVKIDEKVVKNWAKKLFDPYLCPLLAHSLKGLPPTLLVVAEYDVLRDEAQAFADRLRSDGVELTILPVNTFHGAYCFFQDSKAGTEVADGIVKYLGKIDKPKAVS